MTIVRSNVIFCGNKCLPVDDRHPYIWDRVRKCATKEQFAKDGNPLSTMKDMIVDVAKQGNDDVA